MQLFFGIEDMLITTIYAAGAVYMKVKGSWTHSPVTPEQVVKQEQENWHNGKTTCRNLRDESVSGEAAAVYSMHGETSDPDQKFDGQVWISKSKSKGLPLRREQDIDGGNDVGKSHQSVRYEYCNIQPPLLGSPWFRLTSFAKVASSSLARAGLPTFSPMPVARSV